ncbi:MAG: (S)-2-hydroxy-acid oxidase, partial [Bacteroidota bacterium]
ALEFMERDAIAYTLQFVDDVQVDLTAVEAHLLIEVDGTDEASLMLECEKILDVLEKFEVGEVLFAEDHEQKEKLWKVRRKVGEAVKSHSIYKEEDTVVPRFELPVLLRGVKEIGSRYGFQSVCYGHAGDGNLHVNILKGQLTDEEWSLELPKAIKEIFELVVSLNGTLSGEHGIGFVQKEYMPIAFNEIQLNLMKQIKQVFDPNGILNPGKIFPSSHSI